MKPAKQEPTRIMRELEKHRTAIAKERDGLRRLLIEIEDLLDPTDRAVEALDEAIVALSEKA